MKNEEKISETKQELLFMKKLGKFSKDGKKLTRYELLMKYRNAINKRVDWDGINKFEILYKIDEYIAESCCNGGN